MSIFRSQSPPGADQELKGAPGRPTAALNWESADRALNPVGIRPAKPLFVPYLKGEMLQIFFLAQFDPHAYAPQAPQGC